MHDARGQRHGGVDQHGADTVVAQGHYGVGGIGAPPRLPHLPPHRAVRAPGHMPAPRLCHRPVRGLPQERPVRAQGHHPIRRHRPYDAPELQIPEPARREQRPLLRHGLQPVHRVRALRKGLRGDTGRQRNHVYGAGRGLPGWSCSWLLASGVRLRVLRRVHRRLPGGRAGGDGV